jgi:hypothetical protein
MGCTDADVERGSDAVLRDAAPDARGHHEAVDARVAMDSGVPEAGGGGNPGPGTPPVPCEGMPDAPGTTLLVVGTRGATRLALDEERVYFAGHSGGCTSFGCQVSTTFGRVCRIGGEPEWFSVPTVYGPPSGSARLEIADGYVFLARWIQEGPTTVVTRFPTSMGAGPVSGGVDIASCTTGITGLTVTRLGAFGSCWTSVWYVPLGSDQSTTLATGAAISHVAVDGSVVYFADGNAIRSVDLETGEEAVIFAGTEPWRALAVEGTTLATVSGSGVVGALNLADGSTTVLGAWDPNPTRTGTKIVVRDGYVYYASEGGIDAPWIVRVRPDGSESTPLFERSYDDLAVDGEMFYWTDAGNVLRGTPEGIREFGTEDTSPPVFVRTIADFTMATSGNGFTAPVPFFDTEGGVTLIGPSGIEGQDGGLFGTTFTRYSASGDLVTARALEQTDVEGGSAVCSGVDSAGRIVVLQEGGDHLVKKVLDADGSVTASTRVDGYVQTCVLDRAGRVYVGHSGDTGWAVSGVTAEGSLSWSIPAYPPTFAPLTDGFVGVLQCPSSDDEPVLGSLFCERSGAEYAILVFRVTPDGEVAWSHTVRSGGPFLAVSTNTLDEIVLVGSTSSTIDAGTGAVSARRPGLVHTTLVRLAPNGDVRWVRTFDGVFGGGGVALDDDGSIVLATGEADRAFYLGPPGAPGNHVEGFMIARLDPEGEPIASRDLEPHIEAGVSERTAFSPVRVVASGSRVYVTGIVDVAVRSSNSPPTLPSVVLAAYDL